ncbi:hypothetical protein CSPB12327_08545 [Campylobacter sp. RM12327]|uniref:hypothetical protein n=1 Tax=Campylobacter sputorum TaxID=206 RepID=UPI0018965C17|nr:hypothetical protein [Campylobacter sp. RM12327]MBF6670182.1 hypothetical protein [Campylobacter sp. RM12327]
MEEIIVVMKSSFIDKINIINAGKLFTDDSPHSEYICEDFAKDDEKNGGVKCGYRP